jgi:uncharacterized protein YndB with AHSA1/START domain
MPNIHHAVLIAAPAEKVFDALTTQAGLSAWWTPHVETNAHIQSVAKFTFGGGYFKEMKIVALSAPEHVEWRCVAGADEWIDTTISFKIEAGRIDTILVDHPELRDQLEQGGIQNDTTILTLHHDNWAAYTPMFAECNYTWAWFLGSLKLYCETGKGKPWPAQHGK